MSCCLSAGVSSRKCLITCSASPSCRSLASCSVSDLRSCMNRGRIRRPQRGAVGSLLAVSCGPACTIPSPVSMSCSRKSLYGWITLLPNASSYDEHPAINGRSRTGRGDRRYVTRAAAGAGEQVFSSKSGSGVCEDCIARGHLRAPDELRKMIDIGKAESVRNVLRVCRHLADGRGVLRAQSVGHAHFVQVGVADEREQTAVLVFPAETPNTRLAWCLQNRHLDGFAVDPARADFGLACGDCQQRAVVDRFDESISQSVERCAQCPNILGDWNVFLCLRNDGAIIHYGTAANLVSATVDWHRGIHEIAVCIAMAGPQLGELARSAAYRVLMALDTCSRVEHWPESCAHIVRGLVDLLIELKSVARRLGNSVARA